MKYDVIVDEYFDGDLPSVHFMPCYDMIGDDDFIGYDIDVNYLCIRSACEFVREHLPKAVQKDLDKIDAFWKAHPKDFNRCFSWYHGYTMDEKHRYLGNYIRDRQGNIPRIPKSHWWWFKLDETGDDTPDKPAVTGWEVPLQRQF